MTLQKDFLIARPRETTSVQRPLLLHLAEGRAVCQNDFPGRPFIHSSILASLSTFQEDFSKVTPDVPREGHTGLVCPSMETIEVLVLNVE